MSEDKDNDNDNDNNVFTTIPIIEEKTTRKSLNFVRIPQTAPGAHAAQGHVVENSIPLSIFPIATDKFCFVFCGLPGRGKTHIANRLKRYVIIIIWQCVVIYYI